MSLSANPVARGGSFGSGSGILAGRLGGPQFGIVAIGVDVGATNLLRALSAESILAGRNINKLNTSLAATTTVLGNMVKGLGIATVGISGAAFIAKEFDDNLARLSAISGRDVGEIMDTIGEKAIELSKDLGISAAAISESAIVITQAGFSLKETQLILEPLTQFGAATGGDVTKAAKLAVDVIKTFRIEIEKLEDANEVFNTLAFAINNAKVDVTTLTQGFSQAGSAASQLGVSLESVIAVLGALGSAGLQGSPGGTGIKTGLLDILSPAGNVEGLETQIAQFKSTLAATGDIVVAFDQLIFGLGGNARDLGRDMAEVREEIGDFTTATDEQLEPIITKYKVLTDLTNIFGKRAVRSFLALSVVAEEAIAQTVAMELQFESVKDAADRATEAFSAQAGRIRNQFVASFLGDEFRDGLSAALQEIAEGGQAEELGRTLQDVIVRSLNAIANNSEQIIDAFNSLSLAAGAFASAIEVSQPALAAIASIISAMPDQLVGSVAAFFLLNKLFGQNLKNLLSTVKLYEEQNKQLQIQKAIEFDVSSAKHAQMNLEATQLSIKKAQTRESLAIEKANLSETAGTQQLVTLEKARFDLEMKRAELQRLQLMQQRQILKKKIESGEMSKRQEAIARQRIAVINAELNLLPKELSMKRKSLEIELNKLRLSSSQNAKARSRIAILEKELQLIIAQERAEKKRLATAAAPPTGGLKGAGGATALLSGLTAGAFAVAIGDSIAKGIASKAREEEEAAIEARVEALKRDQESVTAFSDAVKNAGESAINFGSKVNLLGTFFTDEEGNRVDGATPGATRRDSVLFDTSDLSDASLQRIREEAAETGTILLDLQKAQEQGFISELQYAQIENEVNNENARIAVANEKFERSEHIKTLEASESAFGVFLQNIGIGVLNTLNLLAGLFGAVFQTVARVGASNIEILISGILHSVANGLGLLETLLEGFLSGVAAGINVVIRFLQKFGFKKDEVDTNIDINIGAEAVREEANRFLDLALEGFRSIPELWSDESLLPFRVLELAESTEAATAANGEWTASTSDYLVAVRKAKESTNFLEEKGIDLAEELDKAAEASFDMTKILKRIEAASVATQNGIQTFTNTFFELQATGFRLSNALDQFADFFLTQEMIKITEEIQEIFHTVGTAVPTVFTDLNEIFKEELFAQALGIADLFDPDGFDAENFIEILAKALDSPRFEQNNNIVVRVTTTGDTSNVVDLGDQIVSQLRNRGVTV